MLFTTLCSTLLVLAPLTLAQSSSITSMSGMVPMPTPSAPPVTMAWNDAPTAVAAEASSLNSAMQSAISSMSMASGMTMSDGSVMSMSETSGVSDALATGTAMAGMNMTGAAGRMEVGWGVEMVLASLGLSVGVVAGML